MKKSILTCMTGIALAACGGGAGSDASDTVVDTGISNGETQSTNSETADSNNGDGDPTGDGDGDPGDGDPTTTGDGDPTTTGNGPKWDLGGLPDSNIPCTSGDGGSNDPDFSFLWACNSTQGTISKLDTQTVTEVGRYVVRPDGQGSPSRTSVSLSGHVAVASRQGGVTKIYANPDLCEESNGMPGIQTSNSNQFLPWGTEECIAWHTPFNYASQRPVAWGLGEFNEGFCQWQDEELWTSGTNGQTIDVLKLDGDDGTVQDMVTIQGVNPGYYGIYGAAVDGNGDFWGSQLGVGQLIRVRHDDMTYQTWPMATNGYGMTVDSDGYVWTCSSSVGRFDPQTETWQTANVGGSAGCMADSSEDGLLWMANGSGVVGVDRETLQVQQTWNAAGSYGISIDFEGYVWAVAYGTTASKIDPTTGQFWTYNGLVGAYTYSDMTGYALVSVGNATG